MRDKSYGFTMVEIMVTLAILGIMLAAAGLSFQSLVQNNRITTEINRLLADVQFSRSEAMKRGRRVILCRSGDPTAGALTIKTNSTSNNNLEFNADASTNESGGTARFAVCDNRGATYGKMIEIPPVGKPRLASSVSSCTAPS